MKAIPFLSVTGVGVVHSTGGKDSIEIVKDMPWPHASPAFSEPADKVRPDIARLAAYLPAKKLRRVPFYARMALLAAFDALQQAGLSHEAMESRMALVLGTAFSCVQMNMDFMDSIIDNGPQLSSPTAFSHAVNNVGTGLLSLLLGIRGPCFTVSQFELSFAGALTTATALLSSQRADVVLLGVVDEVDSRFSACCPQLFRDGLPLTEGAAFFCLKCETPGLPRLRTLWGADAERGIPVFLSGTACSQKGTDHEPQWGHGPMTHALDVVHALAAIHRGETAAVDCLCRSTCGGRGVVVQARSAQ